MKKIAIVGAGFAGLAAAYHLLEKGGAHITLYDQAGIGGGASGIAAGLLHPYAGAHAKKNRFGDEGMEAATHLIDLVEAENGAAIAERKGILRVALTEEQREDYASCAEKHDDVEWVEDSSARVEGVPSQPGIMIRSGLAIDCPRYLEGLWTCCQRRGAALQQEQVEDLKELDADHIVVTAGIRTSLFKELASLKLRPIKGQLLELAWPGHLPPLPFPLNSKAYLVMDRSGKKVYAGATFERQFSSEEVDIDAAKERLLPKVAQLYPPLASAKILNCRSAVRAAAPDHLPLIGQVDDQLSYLTGLGSKGLLYHAFYGKKIADILL